MRPFGSLVLNVAFAVFVAVAFVRAVMRHAPGDKVTLGGRGIVFNFLLFLLALEQQREQKENHCAEHAYKAPWYACIYKNKYGSRRACRGDHRARNSQILKHVYIIPSVVAKIKLLYAVAAGLFK